MRQLIIPFSLTVLFLLNTSSGLCQEWDLVFGIGGNDNEVCQGLSYDSSGNLIVAGTFKGNLATPFDTMQTIGEEDLFLFQYNSQGTLTWARHFGSILEDEIGSLASFPSNEILIGGSFWNSITFEDQELLAEGNPKALFLTQLASNGQLNWATAISGSTLKELTDLVIAPDESFYITGFFEGILNFPDTTLSSIGVSDLFLAKWSKDGTLMWVKQAGFTGDTRASALDLDSNGNILLTGTFNQSVVFGLDTLIAATNDLDGFLVKYDAQGNPIWSKRIGGVHEDEMIDLKVAPTGSIYLTGNLVGVINLDNGLSIQSSSGNPNAFLIKFQSEGTAEWAKSLGGTLTEQSTKLDYQNGTVVICGFYQGDWEYEGIQLTSTSNIQGFTAGFQSAGDLRWLLPISGTGSVFSRSGHN